MHDASQISTLGRQLFLCHSSELTCIYRDATTLPYSYLVVDMSPNSESDIRVRTHLLWGVSVCVQAIKGMPACVENYPLDTKSCWIVKRDLFGKSLLNSNVYKHKTAMEAIVQHHITETRSNKRHESEQISNITSCPSYLLSDGNNQTSETNSSCLNN